jgi:2,4-diketo-3-deoxy-L-fuconate hydrolase
MKLMRYGAKGAEKPALVDAQGQVRDLSGELADITAATLTPHGLQRCARWTSDDAAGGGQPGPHRAALGGCEKFVCIGLNYADHAAESGLPIPKEPIIFMKPISARVGPNDPVVLPRARSRATGRSSSASSSAARRATCPRPTR